MLEEMVKSIVKKSIAVDYPHLKLPTVVFAKVDSVKKLDFQARHNRTSPIIAGASSP